MKNLHKKIKAAGALLIGAIGIVFFSVPTVFASDAAIFLSPITGVYTTGTPFTLAVMVGSGGEAVNAVEGRLEFDPKELEIISTDISSSVLTSWTVTPTFTNESGELSFAGLLATSTVLTRGEMLKFTVKPLRTGELHIRFATGAAVHAADGTGGNILSQLSGGVYVTKPFEVSPTPSSVGDAAEGQGEVLGAATGTNITSSSHPDQERWYATGTALFNWITPPNTQSILLAFNKKENGEGVNPYSATIEEKQIRDIKDGVWYFHLTRLGASGEKDTTTYRINVDTTPPVGVSVSEAVRETASIPNVGIALTATDSTSGVDHYAFELDQLPESIWTDNGTHIRIFEGVSVGVHTLTVSAVDKAGNRTSGRLEFAVEYLPTPALTIQNSAFIERDKLKLNLTSVPNAKLSIYIAHANTSPSTEEFTVDDKGRGVFTSALALSPGSYTASVVAQNNNGALSKSSEPVSFEVNSSFIGVIKRHPLIPVALLGIIALLYFSWFFWRRMSRSGNASDSGEDEFADAEAEVYHHVPIKEAPPVREVRQGAVVLSQRKKIEMPATRL